MRIFVDADACPKVIKDILFRAAIRTETKVILIANKRLEIPRSPFITMHQVAAGFDVADNEIVLQVTPGDLVVTADISLADLVIQKGGLALNPRGRLYTKTNIKQYLTTRNIMTELRDSGIITGGPDAIKQRDQHEFANQLDRLITKNRGRTVPKKSI